MWLASCWGSINGMCDYCTLDFRIFLLFLASYFFDLACSRRYLYDPSNYHSSFLLILIIHLPFLWEMWWTHHDSIKSRNYDDILLRDINFSLNSHSFLHTHYWDIGLQSTHIIYFSTYKFLIFLSTILIPRIWYVDFGDAQPHT